MNEAKREVLLQLSNERKAIDEVLLLLDIFETEGIKEAAKPLQTSFMWLGMAKGALGAENPYPKSTDPTSPSIEPAQDKAISVSIPHATLDPKDPVAVIKWLRGRIGIIVKAILNDGQVFPNEKLYQISVSNAWTYACNAKMELGLALGKLRKDPDPTVKIQSEDDPNMEEMAVITALVEGADGKVVQENGQTVIILPENPDPTIPAGQPLTEPPSGEALLQIQSDALAAADNKRAEKRQARQAAVAEQAKKVTESTQPVTPTTDEGNTQGGDSAKDLKKSGGNRPKKVKAANKAPRR